MENNNDKISIGCISPLTVILFLAFFIAKIFEKIDWSWWWVFSPLWIPLAIFLIVVIGTFLVIFISALIDTIWKR